MTIQKTQTVYSVNSTLHAVQIQSTLECAGIPSVLRHAKYGASLDVLVPEAWAGQARQLLNPERRSGEIFTVPA